MGLTRTQLEDRCIQYNYGELDRVRLGDFLNQRYRDVLARHRWSWNRSVSTVNLTAGTNSISLPSINYIFFGRLRPLGVGVHEPEYIAWDTMRENNFTRRAFDSTQRGMPKLYSILNDTIYFDLYADVAYSYESNVWPLPTYMTTGATESILPDEDREVLVYGAVMDAMLRDRDWTGAKTFNELYEGRIQEMWSKDKFNNAESVLKVEMPSHYYGLFS